MMCMIRCKVNPDAAVISGSERKETAGAVSFSIKNKEVLLVETILQAVGNVGFPIAVTAYLLVRIEAKLSDLTASIAELARAIEAGGSK